ncbi:hypothetical protein [uncultured Marinobacter sp.]|uniref:hypothetical protein n=1 Tax=uncultured Marinobacter sp. TaxID=187379 RepID=UPI0030DD986B
MSKADANTDRYIAIARACLKAINDTAADNGSREQKIQAVYDAIDTAFQAEMAEQHRIIAVLSSVLERIATGEMDGPAATTLARITLDKTPKNASQSRMH